MSKLEIYEKKDYYAYVSTLTTILQITYSVVAIRTYTCNRSVSKCSFSLAKATPV